MYYRQVSPLPVGWSCPAQQHYQHQA